MSEERLVAIARGAGRRLIELNDELSALFDLLQQDLSAERHDVPSARKRVDADLGMLRLIQMKSQVIRNELERELLSE